MENRGEVPAIVENDIEALWKALIGRTSEMLNFLGFHRITIQTLDDLTLLSLGAQLRGGTNNREHYLFLSDYLPRD